MMSRSEEVTDRQRKCMPRPEEQMRNVLTNHRNFIYRHHVEPRVKLYSPREESFPIPLKYIDVSRNYLYEFGCQAGEMHR